MNTATGADDVGAMFSHDLAVGRGALERLILLERSRLSALETLAALVDGEPVTLAAQGQSAAREMVRSAVECAVGRRYAEDANGETKADAWFHLSLAAGLLTRDASA